MFHANLDSTSSDSGRFTTMVYGTSIQVNPDILSVELRMPRVHVNAMEYPMPTLSPEDKGALTTKIGGFGVPWTSKLDALETTYAARLLNRIFTHNLLPTTHQADMSPEMAYVIRNVLYHRPMDLSEILYTKMIKATESQDPRTSLYFPILITKLMQKNRIKFHSPP